MVKQQAGAALGVSTRRALDGRYRLEGEIGAGGLGVVYRATHEKLDRAVAVKLLHEHCGENQLMRGRFEREAKALASLAHPNIVAVTDYGIAEDTPYLVMELLEGETLSDRLERGALSGTTLEQLSHALLQALSFVHSHGLVHRDVKPSNVFLQRLPDGGERLKLLDFGLAKFTANDRTDPTLTRAGSVVGTPAYMSPEQASGENIDTRSDVYSAGVILLQMLAGRLPYLGDAIDQLRSHMIAPIPSLRELCPRRTPSPELDAFLKRALAKRREDRFATATEMATALEALPKPWFEERELSDKELGVARTLLAEPATLPVNTEPPAAGSGSRARVTPADTRPAKPRPRLVRLVVVSLTLAGGLYGAFRLRHHEMFAAAGESIDAPQPSAASSPEPRPQEPTAPAAQDALRAAAAAVATAVNAADHAQASAVDATHAIVSSAREAIEQAQAGIADPSTTTALPDEAVRHTEPIESERDEVVNLASVAPKPRSTAQNPWRKGVPKELRKLRGAIAAGARGNDHAIAALRRYNRENPNDVRGHLLLASLYMNREWRADAVNQYGIAYQLDASSRGAPEELPNLLAIVAKGFSISEAERFIELAYRTEALPALERALRKQTEPHAVARLQGLRARLQARRR